VRAAAPRALEIAYQNEPPRSKSAWWKIARYTLGGTEVVGISTSSTRAHLFFYGGAELEDRAGLLEGRGKALRFVRLRTPEDAMRPEVKRMLRNAFQRAADRRPTEGAKP
jgi:hypothetical protein